jgi:hypothetical protein
MFCTIQYSALSVIDWSTANPSAATIELFTAIIWKHLI